MLRKPVSVCSPLMSMSVLQVSVIFSDEKVSDLHSKNYNQISLKPSRDHRTLQHNGRHKMQMRHTIVMTGSTTISCMHEIKDAAQRGITVMSHQYL